LPKVTPRPLSPDKPPKKNPIPRPLSLSPELYEIIDVDNPTASGLSTGPAAADRVSAPELMVTDDLLMRLRTYTQNLPLSIPLGTPSDPFANFSSNPEDLIKPGSDAWEHVIDPAFNRVIGFGLTTAQLADLIKWGHYGMDGFCEWTATCINVLHIAPALLETRVERVIDAMVNL
jgi:hypothetical protein